MRNTNLCVNEGTNRALKQQSSISSTEIASTMCAMLLVPLVLRVVSVVKQTVLYRPRAPKTIIEDIMSTSLYKIPGARS